MRIILLERLYNVDSVSHDRPRIADNLSTARHDQDNKCKPDGNIIIFIVLSMYIWRRI